MISLIKINSYKEEHLKNIKACNWKNPIKIGNYLWCFGRINSSGSIKADRRIIFGTNDKISHE
jgi:hypothetical protein